jgi:hypothetical protein
LVVPLLGYAVLSRLLSGFDAAAISATYGSVSAVTFITAVQFLDSHGQVYGGHMAAAMALMESPAIIMAVLLANLARQRQAGGQQVAPGLSLRRLLHESLTDGAQLLLIGAMLVGMLTGTEGQRVMGPFSVDLFKGMLAFFLLDMGIAAARHMGGLRTQSPWLLVYAILAPLAHAALALAGAWAVGMTEGDGALLMVLAASASYIAVPAVIRHAIPEASPTLYLGLSLGVTFPFNILLGIPLYMRAASVVL